MDYEAIGFKAGIEIHQQLEGKKLFCNCPAIIKDDKTEKPDFIIERQLRASAGETGEVDVAAKAEQKKNKIFKYWCYNDTACLVELDEEPPHDVNKDVLATALQIAKLLNCDLVDEIQFMRKTVVDGSNTSGFQRTALIATDGWVDTPLGKVTIPGVCLEEEAAKIVERSSENDVYNLSRLGIALIEIATGTEIKNPEHAKEVAYKIGLILRSVPGIKRGLGTIRQDVNISIRNGARTEIKGFQDYRNIPKVMDHEIQRQMSEIKKGKTLHPEVRKAEPDFTTSFLRPMPGAARMYPETDVRHVKPGLIKLDVPMLIEDKSKEAQKLGLSKDLADKIAKSSSYDLFEKLSKLKNVKPAYAAEILVSYVPELLRNYEGSDPSKITDEHMEKVFKSLDKGEIAKESLMSVLHEISMGKGLNLEKHHLMSDEQLKKELDLILKNNPGRQFNAVIGIAMGKLRGKADGKKISDILNKMCK